MPKLINVSNRLPVTVREGEIRKSSGGLVAALEGLPTDSFAVEWLGWPGQIAGDETERDMVIEVLRRDWNSSPVELSAEEMGGFYEGLSNSCLWPLLHSMPTYMQFREEWWKAYVDVNRKYADAVLAGAEEGDLVWVHDYQLMLVPAMLRAAHRGLKIGFFLHTPFPPYDVFRFFPRRKELVEGLLGADLVGFHTFGYLSNFREAAERLLDLDDQAVSTEGDQICTRGHAVAMGVFPIGIFAAKFVAELASAEFPGRVANARRGAADRQIVLSVERLDYTKGIIHRLQAIDLYLAGLTPEQRERVEFVFVSVPSREDIEKYKELREEVEAQVGRLNGKYASLTSNPIHFIRGHVDFPDLVALYASADVALVTPLVDGMNLVAKEYLAARADNRGVLILSEFAGAAEELVGAIQVNPHDAAAVAEAIGRALAMPAAQRERAAAPMRNRIMDEDSAFWARSFVGALGHRPLSTPRCEEDETSPVDELAETIGSALASAWRFGGQASMFLDYDGTLREIVSDPAAATVTPDLRKFLDRLAETHALNVTLISGRTPEDMARFVGDYPFALVAEHGAQVRVAHAGGPWMSGTKSEPAWRDAVLPILQLYERLTPGSHVEVKHTSVVWHYRNCNRDLGDFRARRLMRDLAGPTANLPVVTQRGRKIVEVRDASVDKGIAAARILRAHPSPFVLAAGDDVTDESLFAPPLAPTAFSIKIGRGPTSARYRLGSPAQLRRALTQALDRAMAEMNEAASSVA